MSFFVFCLYSSFFLFLRGVDISSGVTGTGHLGDAE